MLDEACDVNVTTREKHTMDTSIVLMMARQLATKVVGVVPLSNTTRAILDIDNLPIGIRIKPIRNDLTWILMLCSYAK
jgi:hypothetical protein